MERLSKKLHSERGASLILALLMFLVCVLVAASVMAAAASNVGKYRSNRAEQQKYLLLSSAIRLVADEIQQAKYEGKYKIYEWDDPDPASGDSYYYIEQVEGDYSCGDLTDQLRLGDELFSMQFTGHGYKALYNTLGTSTKRTLTVTVKGLPEDTGPEVYKVFKKDPTDGIVKAEVTVEVELNHTTRHIRLTASLGDVVMSAELVGKGGLAISYNPGSRTLEPDTTGAPSPTVTVKSTSAMTWELNWIKKGAA